MGGLRPSLFDMETEEIKRRRQEAMDLRKQLGDFEYRKVKAARRREYYDKTRKETLAAAEDVKVVAPIVVKKKPQKQATCTVELTVTDASGKYSCTWNASALMGTVMASRRGEGYLDMAQPALQKLFGKLTK